MSKYQISRRRVLRGVLGGAAVAIGLPRLDGMLNGNGNAYAAGEALPKRFGVWAWANGVRLDRWVPKTTGAGYQLSESLVPLEPVKDYVSVVSGLNLPFGGRVHAAGNCVFMTGQRLTGNSDSALTYARESIDQEVAKVIGATTAIRSLEVGVTDAPSSEQGTAFRFWSHTGPSSPNRPVYSTRDVFTRLFGNVMTATPQPGPTAVDFASEQRKSVLDAVLADAAELNSVLGARDKARLEQHLEGIRAIEMRISSTPPGGGGSGGPLSCGMPPAQPTLVGGATDYNAQVEQINKCMAEMLALGLACDVTRVFTFQLVNPGTEVIIKSVVDAARMASQTTSGALPVAPRSYGAHNLSHIPDGLEVDAPYLHAVVVHYMKELSVFVQALRALPEGDGNLLDNCGIIAANDVSDGPTHDLKNFPSLVIGRAGGKLKSGIHAAYPGGNVLRVPLTVARAVGHEMTSFGSENSIATESLAELLA